MRIYLVFVLCGLLGGCSEQPPLRAPNAFNVPATYLGCMEIDIAPGESFGNFDVYQPAHVTMQHDARLHDIYMEQGCVFKETVLSK